MAWNNISEHFYQWLNPWQPHRSFQPSNAPSQWIRNRLVRLYFWSNRQRAIRYAPVLKFVKKHISPEMPVLEIGTGCLGLAPYTTRNVIGLDKRSNCPYLPNMSHVRGNAINLPFPDNGFDLVCSLDMLEHIPSETRMNVVFEICRVARRYVVIGVPCGKESTLWEEKARKRYSELINSNKLQGLDKDFLVEHNRYLFEHVEHGLPEADDILGYLRDYEYTNKRSLKIRVIGNESRYIWYMSALGYMRFSHIRAFLTTLAIMLLNLPASWLKLGGHYRLIFFIELNQDSTQ